MTIAQWLSGSVFRDLKAARVCAIQYLNTFYHQVRFVSSTRVVICALYLATTHKGTTCLGTTEPPGVTGSRGVHGHSSSARSHLVYRAGGSTTLCTPYTHPPVASPSSSNFAGSHPWTCNRLCPSFPTSSSSRSAPRTARSTQRRMTCSCIVRVPFRLCVLCLISCLSQVL